MTSGSLPRKFSTGTDAYDYIGGLVDVDFPYFWAWGQKPGWDKGTPPRMFDRSRKGERCRVVARGRMNSALVQFPDGYAVVTSRNGLRRDDGLGVSRGG